MAYQEITAEKIIAITAKELLLVTFDFTPYLASDETVTGVSGVDSEGTALGITVATGMALKTSPVVNTALIVVDGGDDIAIGKAIQVKFALSGATIGKTYDTHWIFTTSVGSTREAVLTFKAVS